MGVAVDWQRLADTSALTTYGGTVQRPVYRATIERLDPSGRVMESHSVTEHEGGPDAQIATALTRLAEAMCTVYEPSPSLQSIAYELVRRLSFSAGCPVLKQLG